MEIILLKKNNADEGDGYSSQIFAVLTPSHTYQSTIFQSWEDGKDIESSDFNVKEDKLYQTSFQNFISFLKNTPKNATEDDYYSFLATVLDIDEKKLSSYNFLKESSLVNL